MILVFFSLQYLRMWYDKPATSMEDDAIPVGNGQIGALLDGGVKTDTIAYTEKSLWSGGWGCGRGYNAG